MSRRLGSALLAGTASLILAVPAEAVRPGSVKGVSETENTTTATGREVIKSTGGGYVHALTLLCDTAPCEAAVYDSTAEGVGKSGTGTRRWELRASANNSSVSHDFGGAPLVTNDGIAVEVAGTGGSLFIAFE